jgi:hypothetical protein
MAVYDFLLECVSSNLIFLFATNCGDENAVFDVSGAPSDCPPPTHTHMKAHHCTFNKIIGSDCRTVWFCNYKTYRISITQDLISYNWLEHYLQAFQ